jgi:hypothetical protein
MSEAALCYVEIRIRYGATINSPAHFMFLFQQYFKCWIHTLSVKDSNNRKILFTSPGEQRAISEYAASEELTRNPRMLDQPIVSDANLTVLLNEGSSELKQVIDIFLNAPNEIMETLRKEASSYSPKQFWNRVLAYAGISPERSVSLQRELTDLLS